MAVQQTEHQRKFDRQTRLWGDHGQRLIESTNVCVLGSGPVATETLKNLVLPNVQNFTVIDDALVAPGDCGNNFFVTPADIGQPRADVVAKWLVEMNPDVNGAAVQMNPDALLAQNDFGEVFNGFTLVIVTQIYSARKLQKLGGFCRERGVPLLVVRANGLLGYIRLDYGEIDIMESHPSNDRTDLCLYHAQLENFPELREYCLSYDIATDDVEKKAHLPCVAILVQFAQRWVEEKGQLPAGFREQQEFKDELSRLGDNENIDNAIHWAYQVYSPPRVDREVREVLEDPSGHVDNITAESSLFWFCVRGLRDFMENEGNGFLPVSLNVPDMHTDSESYVRLKEIFKNRYVRDEDLIGNYIRKRLNDLGVGADALSDDMLGRFVKNVRSLRVMRMRSLEQEYNSPDLEHLNEQYIDWGALEEGKDDNAEEKPFTPKEINWYWAFRALDSYYDKNGFIAGDFMQELSDEKLDEIAAELGVEQQAIFTQIGLEQEVVNQCLREIVRFGGSQPHTTAAVLGGIASQAALKIILGQFYTFNSTLIWNGIFCSAATFAP